MAFRNAHTFEQYKKALRAMDRLHRDDILAMVDLAIDAARRVGL